MFPPKSSKTFVFLEKINIQKGLVVYNLKKSNFSIRHKTNTGKSILKEVDGTIDLEDVFAEITKILG